MLATSGRGGHSRPLVGSVLQFILVSRQPARVGRVAPSGRDPGGRVGSGLGKKEKKR